MKTWIIPLSCATVLLLASCGGSTTPTNDAATESGSTTPTIDAATVSGSTTPASDPATTGSSDTNLSSSNGASTGAPTGSGAAALLLLTDRTVKATVVSGGNEAPIDGATVFVYRAGTNGATLVGKGDTDRSGNFSVQVRLDDSGDVYYAIASKGRNIVLMSTLGSTPPDNFTINEMTTVASAYAFAQFLTDTTVSGPRLSLQIAAGMAENLVAASTGKPARALTRSPNGDETNAWRVLGTLSNVLTACVLDLRNACSDLYAATPSQRRDFPGNTLQAILNIARNPAASLSAIFELGDIRQAYSPALTRRQGPDSNDQLQRLDAWTLAFKVNDTGSGSCPFGGPANVAFDKQGYVWINHNVVQGTPDSTHCNVVLKPNGEPSDGKGGTPISPLIGGGLTGPGFGIAIDALGNVWTGNFGWGQDLPATGGVSQFSPQGNPLSPRNGWTANTYRVQGIASDKRNNIWMASYFNDSLVIFPAGDATAAIGYSDENTHPFGMAISGDGSGWVSYTGSATVSRFIFQRGEITKQSTTALEAGSNPKGIAIDSQGNAWVVTGKNSTVSLINPAGKLLDGYTRRGLFGPWGVSVDARDNIWVANFGDDVNIGEKYSIVQLCGATTANCPPGARTGDAISPPTGYTLPSGGSEVLLHSGLPLYGRLAPPSYRPLMRLTSANIDMAGNIWVANNWKPNSLNDILSDPGGDGMVIFIGLGAPTMPLAPGPARAP